MGEIRLCLYCKFCDLDFGSRGYSELTPGESASLSCQKGKFGEVELGHHLTEAKFRRLIETAATCEEFKDLKG